MIDTQFIYYEDEKKNPKQHLLTKFVHQQQYQKLSGSTILIPTF